MHHQSSAGNRGKVQVDNAECMEDNSMEDVHVKGVTATQLIPETRQSEHVQDQLMKKYQVQAMERGKKRTLEGKNVPNKNSFSVLSSDIISQLAANMGVSVSEANFDTIDIMKDLECARQALDKVKFKKCPEPCDEIIPTDSIVNEEVPLLEWVDNDSEAEQFTLVQSRKKKKRNCAWLENSARELQVRRSKRTTPSLCRDKGGQENSAPLHPPKS
jgi:hypothetical protein